jgi:hypothetical protein
MFLTVDFASGIRIGGFRNREAVSQLMYKRQIAGARHFRNVRLGGVAPGQRILPLRELLKNNIPDRRGLAMPNPDRKRRHVGDVI